MRLEQIEGMAESFKEDKIVFLTTYGEDGEHTRPMTNFNEDPYVTFWFPSDADTRKVRDIQGNSNVSVSFPAAQHGRFYVIEGEGYLASQAVIRDRWRWWWLYWHPHAEEMYPQPQSSDYFAKKAIIMIKPLRARIVEGGYVERLLRSMPRY
jgi:general stress protein 26